MKDIDVRAAAATLYCIEGCVYVTPRTCEQLNERKELECQCERAGGNRRPMGGGGHTSCARADAFEGVPARDCLVRHPHCRLQRSFGSRDAAPSATCVYTGVVQPSRLGPDRVGRARGVQ